LTILSIIGVNKIRTYVKVMSISFYANDDYWTARVITTLKGKGKVFPYSLPSVRPRADSGDFLRHPLGGRLPLFSQPKNVTILRPVLFGDKGT